MIFNDSDYKRIFFLIPYINQNTTSVNRIHSLILEALKRQELEVKVLYYDFSELNIASIGIDGNQTNVPESIKSNTLYLTPSFNVLQKLAFWLINKKFLKLYKLSTAIHQLLYSSDIFTIHRINQQIKDLKLSKSDLIVALGGPFGIFKTALNLKKKYQVNISIDYRDPWTYGYTPIDGSYLFHLVKQLFIRREEKKILSEASSIFTVSDSIKNFFPNKYRSKFYVIPNAANYLKIDIDTAPTTFNIIYLGTVYDIQLIDTTFFKVLSNWIKDKSNVKLIFLGSKNNITLKKIISNYQLSKNTEITKRLEKDEVKTFLEKASIFLHLKYGDRKEIITSKQADYLTFRKPILLPVSDDGDIAESIIKNKAGYVCNQEEDILKVLDKLYRKFLNGSVEVIEENESYKINNREYWAAKFIDLVLTPPNSW